MILDVSCGLEEQAQIKNPGGGEGAGRLEGKRAELFSAQQGEQTMRVRRTHTCVFSVGANKQCTLRQEGWAWPRDI